MSADSGLGMNQSVKFKVEVAPVIVERPVEDYVQRTKKSAGYLRLLLHSKRCGGLCMKAACIKTSSVVDHVNKCFDPQCTYPGCITSKKLLEHHDTCALNMSLNTGLSNFCLLCSLVPQATTSPTNRSHYLSPDQNNAYGTPQLEESDRYSEVYDRRTHDGCFVHAFCRTASQDPGDHPSASSDSPIMFDEMIEYNKVPFQDSRSEYLRHSMTSDLPPNVYSDEPPRKIRSKSMNAVSIDWTA